VTAIAPFILLAGIVADGYQAQTAVFNNEKRFVALSQFRYFIGRHAQQRAGETGVQSGVGNDQTGFRAEIGGKGRGAGEYFAVGFSARPGSGPYVASMSRGMPGEKVQSGGNAHAFARPVVAFQKALVRPVGQTQNSADNLRRFHATRQRADADAPDMFAEEKFGHVPDRAPAFVQQRTVFAPLNSPFRIPPRPAVTHYVNDGHTRSTLPVFTDTSFMV
jgi:hypothetical protein